MGLNTFSCLRLPREERSSGAVFSDEETELELTPLLSGVGVVPGGLCWFELGPPS